MIDYLQTVAIIVTLLLSVWQWKKTRQTIKVDNFSKIIGALNDIRKERLAVPQLERNLFERREDMTDDQIRTRVYGVMFANIIEWTIFSRDSGLIDDKRWEDWISVLKDVILSDNSFAKLMSDRTIYTFNFGAHELVIKLIEEIKKDESA